MADAPSDYDEANTASVTDDAGSNPTISDKVHPIKLTWGNSSSSTGTGDCEFTTSNVDGREDIGAFDINDNSQPFEIAHFDTTNNVAWVWVYFSSLTRDNTDQVKIAAGSGSTNDSGSGVSSWDGGGSNPWEQTGVAAFAAYHNEQSPDADSGTNEIKDSTDNGHDLDTSGTSNESSGQFGSALQFDGTDDNATRADENSLDNTGDLSVAAFVKPSSISGTPTRTITAKGDAWRVGVQADDPRTYLFRDDSNNTDGWLADNDNWSTGSWQHFGLAHDLSAGSGDFYRNGSGNGNFSGLSVTSRQSNADALSIGSFSGGSRHFAGDMDALRIYTDIKGSEWMGADWDASPAGGQALFSWNGATSTSTTTTITATETMTLSDQYSRVFDGFRTYSDTVTLTDSLSKLLKKGAFTESFSLSDDTTKTFKKNLTESLTLTADYSSNYGELTGQVKLDGSGVQGADVYAVKQTDLSFVGSDTTDSNGNYTITSVPDNEIILVAVDYDDSGTLYGEEKSIDFSDSNN